MSEISNVNTGLLLGACNQGLPLVGYFKTIYSKSVACFLTTTLTSPCEGGMVSPCDFSLHHSQTIANIMDLIYWWLRRNL